MAFTEDFFCDCFCRFWTLFRHAKNESYSIFFKIFLESGHFYGGTPTLNKLRLNLKNRTNNLLSSRTKNLNIQSFKKQNKTNPIRQISAFRRGRIFSLRVKFKWRSMNTWQRKKKFQKFRKLCNFLAFEGQLKIGWLQWTKSMSGSQLK